MHGQSNRCRNQIITCGAFQSCFKQTSTFKSRNVILLCCDLEVLCHCLFELAQSLFDSSCLVDAVDGAGLKLMGLAKCL